MFCRKFKDLKITGECPFSLLAPGQVPTEPTEEVAGGSEGCRATLPICQDIPEKNPQGNLPQRKTSRNRVYLHTLAESIRKLIFPEVSVLLLTRTMVFQNSKRKSFQEKIFRNVSLAFNGMTNRISLKHMKTIFLNNHSKLWIIFLSLIS